MTEKNAICSGCGEQVLVEANGQKDDTCACDPVCIVCRRQFKPWLISDPDEPRRDICPDCFEGAMDELRSEYPHLLSRLESREKHEWKHPLSQATEQGARTATRWSLYALKLDVYDKVIKENR